jgi:hypothetical protein
MLFINEIVRVSILVSRANIHKEEEERQTDNYIERKYTSERYVYYFEYSTIVNIKLSHNAKQSDSDNDGTSCDYCGNPLEACMCVCPYCGELNGCECCLYDAVTGGG